MSKLSSREKILHKGLDLLTKRGFDSLTIGILAQRVQLSKSGLFAHFKSKDELQLALLDQSVQTADNVVVAAAMAKPVGLPRLYALVNGWFGWTTRAGLCGGCPIAAGMFEYDDHPDGPVRRRLLQLEQKWRRLLHDTTEGAISCGHLSSKLDIEQFVWELCGIYLSHHVSFRFVRDPNATKKAAHAFAALIKRSK